MESRYNYVMPGPFDVGQLDALIRPALPALLGVGNVNDTTVQFVFPNALAAQATLDAMVASYVYQKPRKPRPLYAILADLNALTPAQQQAVANDLFAGTPFKVLLDAGPNAAALFALHWATQAAGVSAADKTLAKKYAAAMYCQDVPAYLVKPAFDPAINVRGDA